MNLGPRTGGGGAGEKRGGCDELRLRDEMGLVGQRDWDKDLGLQETDCIRSLGRRLGWGAEKMGHWGLKADIQTG